MMFLLLHVTCSCIFHMYVPFFSILLILIVFGTLPLVFLFLSLFRLVYAWHQRASLLHPRTLFVPRHLLLILLLLMSDFVMIKTVRTFQRIFLNVAFIWNAKSFFQTFSILTYPLSSTIGVRSPFMTSWSPVPL